MRHTTVAAAAALMTITCVGAYAALGAPGETVGHQTLCWNMTPFEDELALDVALVEPRSVGFHTIFGSWDGNGHYLIQAAGDGQTAPNGKRVSVSLVFFNHTDLASRNRWGRFAASLQLSTLKGPWSLAIAGDGRPEGDGSGTPYVIQGFLVPKPCSQLGTVPRGDPPNLVLAPAYE